MLNKFICIASKEAKMTPASEVIEGILSTGNKDKYYCPICGEELVFKNCTEKEKHFSHKSDTTCNYSGGGGESEDHKIVKRYLAENIGDTFQIRGNDIVGTGKTFVLGGTRKILVKDIHIEKSLKNILKLDRDYRPDITIEAVTGELIALEVYNTHAKTQDDIENLKGTGIIVYEIDIKGLDKLDINVLYDRMKLIYSYNLMQLSSTLNNMRYEFKKIRAENKSCKEKVNELKELERDIKRLEFFKNEASQLRGRVNELETKVKNYETTFPNSGSMDVYVKEVIERQGVMFLKVGNSRAGDILVTSKDKQNFPFMRDILNGFGRIEWVNKNGLNTLKNFTFKDGMLQNKNHFLYHTFTIDYIEGKLFYRKGGYKKRIESWDSFKIENLT